MNAIREELFSVEVYSFGILFFMLLWLYLQGRRQRKTQKQADNIDDRVKIIELWPTPNDKLKDHEERISYLERELDALKHNPFTKEALRRVK